MRASSDLSPATAFDPFGEPVADGLARDGTASPGDRTARRICGAIFWTLAFIILAGRIYASDFPVVQTVADYAARAVAWM